MHRNKNGTSCPSRVKSCPDGPEVQLPLHPRKQTFGGRTGMSAKCPTTDVECKFRTFVRQGSVDEGGLASVPILLARVARQQQSDWNPPLNPAPPACSSAKTWGSNRYRYLMRFQSRSTAPRGLPHPTVRAPPIAPLAMERMRMALGVSLRHM